MPVFLALGVALGASACSSSRETFGIEKAGPNEFEVLTRAPLSIPPEYGLRTPTPGAKRPQETSAQQGARQILLQSSGRLESGQGGQRSKGEGALLRQAGAAKPDPGIRATINRENKLLGGKGAGLTDIILFWREVEEKSTVVDAAKEAQRLRENAALGDPPTKGRTPTITREERGILEGLFN